MIIIVLLYSIFLLLFLIFKSYQKTYLKTISKKTYHLTFLFPISLMIADTIRTLLPKQHTNRKEKCKALYVFEDSNEKSRLFLTQMISYAIGVLLLFNTFALIMQVTQSKEAENVEESIVKRPDYGEKSHSESYQVVIDNEEFTDNEEITYKVAPRVYTEESFCEALEQAKKYIMQKVLGENKAADNIRYPLNLIKTIPALGIKVSWIRDDEGMVQYDGSIVKNNLTQDKKVTLTAVVRNGRFEEELDFVFTLKAYEQSSKEALLQKITTAVHEVDNANSTEKEFMLPEEVDGTKVYFFKEKHQQYIIVLFLGVLLAILIPILAERRFKEQLEQRENELKMDYPELVNKLVLLLEAGMTVTRAWAKIVEDYETDVKQNKRRRRYAYEEMLASYYELKNGLSESQVYDNFGRRIKLTPYMKLSSLLAQNTTKGMEGLLSFMKGESMEAFAERKELAKRLGEKAGTKMLLPMGLMLAVILVIIIVPAFTMF